METFCRRFLLRHTDYEHLHVITDTYREKYKSIVRSGMFTCKDSLNETFPAICRTLLRERGDGPSYILATLGFAFHVHTTCQDADWYELDMVINHLTDILTCTNFDYTANYYCKPSNYCIIL